ncbi:MFS transporter [Streptosporangium sp. NPDC048047]|uniref:MFS transporter n=1 Tax=Streptosporangium sp. NPDC048047 TaxID=3155748 RepID=UPI003417AC75
MSPHRAIAAVFALHGAVAGSLATRVPWIQDHLGLSPAVLGFVLFCPSIGAFVGMPMAARLAHRLGGTVATRLLIALWCAGLALPALMPAPAWLFPTFLLYGAAAGMSDVVMNSHAVVVERHLGRSIMSGLHGMWSVGSLVAAGAGTLAAQAEIDARLHLGVTALVLVALAAVAGRGLLADTTSAGAPAPRRFALPSRAIAVVGLLGFCATFAEGSSTNWSALYLTEVTDAGPGVAAAGYTVFMFFMAGTRLIGDRFVRRFGAVATVRAGGAVAVIGGVIVVASRAPLPGIAGFALLGLGIAVIVPLVFVTAGNTGPTPGDGVAGVATITYLSGLLAPAVTGWIADGLSYPAAFGVITGVIALVPFLAVALRPRAAASAPEPAVPTGRG